MHDKLRNSTQAQTSSNEDFQLPVLMAGSCMPQDMAIATPPCLSDNAESSLTDLGRTGVFKLLQTDVQVMYADRVCIVPCCTEIEHVNQPVEFHGDDVLDFP